MSSAPTCHPREGGDSVDLSLCGEVGERAAGEETLNAIPAEAAIQLIYGSPFSRRRIVFKQKGS